MFQHIVKTPKKPTNSKIFQEETGCDLLVREDVWYVVGDVSAAEAQELLDAHNPAPTAEPTIAEKLASVGLNLDDLKEALGLG